MLKFEQYARPGTTKEAYDLLQGNRLATVIGGMMWLRLSDRTIPLGIDLAGCGLDKIEETEDAFVIGAMVTLGQLENHDAFRRMTRGVFTDGVHDIIGTQFRNLATVGGSAYARMGFSDIVTALLPLDTWVEFTGAGTMRFCDFVNGGAARDVLERIVVKKHDYRASFQCLRNSATDFSTLNVCAALWENEWHLAVGARPKKAKFLEGEDLALPAGFTPEQLAAACENARYLNYGTDRRASADYRAELAEVLTRRAILAATSQQSVEDELAAIAKANKPRGISQ